MELSSCIFFLFSEVIVETQDRKLWLSVMAKADHDFFSSMTEKLLLPEHEFLRAPEIGSVMVQGRMGGTGNAFNMGEMTVTRCSLRLRACGTTGHGYIQGRNKMLAQVAAICDALLQTSEAQAIIRDIIQPLQIRAEQDAAKLARQSAATKVDFFTMVRGN